MGHRKMQIEVANLHVRGSKHDNYVPSLHEHEGLVGHFWKPSSIAYCTAGRKGSGT